MKRYCLLFFSLLLSLFTLNVQNVDEWDTMKGVILSWLHSPKTNFQELSNGYDEVLPYAAWDFQVENGNIPFCQKRKEP